MMSKVMLEGFGYQLQRLSGRYMFDAKLACAKHHFDNKSRGSWLCDGLVCAIFFLSTMCKVG
jgi:hypothetical protein